MAEPYEFSEDKAPQTSIGGAVVFSIISAVAALFFTGNPFLILLAALSGGGLGFAAGVAVNHYADEKASGGSYTPPPTPPGKAANEKAQEEARKKAEEQTREAQQKAEEAEKRAREAGERKSDEARKAREEAEKTRSAEREARAREREASKAQEAAEAERKAKDDAYRKAEVERKAKEEEAARKAKEDAERKAAEAKQAEYAKKARQNANNEADKLPRFAAADENDFYIRQAMAASFEKSSKFRGDGNYGFVDEGIINRLIIEFSSGNAQIKEVNENGYRYALITGKGDKQETWYIDNTYVNRDKEGCCFVNKKDSSLRYIERASNLSSIDGKKLLERLNARSKNYENEKADKADVKSFDLPRDRPIGFLGFHGMGSDSDDLKFSENVKGLKHVPGLLKKCGYDMVYAENGAEEVEMLKKDPAKRIDARIEELHKKGVRDFYISVYAHGSEEGLHFGWVDNGGIEHSSTLQPRQWKEIVNKYSDSNFVLDTEGCHAGGFVNMMEGFQDVKGAQKARVTAFCHTKESHVNYSRQYEYLRIQKLLEMAEGKEGAPKTYGELHQQIDKILQNHQMLYLDPEFWKSNPGAPSDRTADKNSRADSIPDAFINGVMQFIAGNTTSAPKINPELPTHGLPNEAGVAKINGIV